MAKIKSLYRDYFQKSRVFLYPALEIKRGVSVTPVESYVTWDGHIGLKDYKLLCTYHLRDDKEFTVFEKNRLFGNPMFDDYIEIEEDYGLYMFDFEPYAEDFEYFLKGKYSKMSNVLKRKIKNFYGVYSSNFAYIESYLHPDKYFGLYSDLLNVSIADLKISGELCDPPDLEKENLIAEIKPISLKQITI